MFNYFLKTVGLIFSFFSLAFVSLTLFLSAVFFYYSKDLPSLKEIENYSPPTLSRVYDSNSVLIDLFAREKRIYTPIKQIPKLVQQGFISAEDKNFYTHKGYDLIGLMKALIDAMRGKKLRGASTITQQVMKNFLLSGERTTERKIKEIILASRIEKVLSKDEILSVYLNEIYLGQGAYGVTVASLIYFNKKLHELSISDVAFLSSLPKAPSFYHPVRQKEKATLRRNFVIKEMRENGFITEEEAYEAKNLSLVTSLDEPERIKFNKNIDRSYFTDEIRRQIIKKYGKPFLFNDGLTIKATLIPELQHLAVKVLRSELSKFDRAVGIYRGPLGNVGSDNLQSDELLISGMANIENLNKINDWRLAVVKSLKNEFALVLLKDNSGKISEELINIIDSKWIKKSISSRGEIYNPKLSSDLWSVGDIIYLKKEYRNSNNKAYWELRQIPEIQGAIIAMDPNSGAVLAMQGGFSYKLSAFNRATQAFRQPGSVFKPFVYYAALENGHKPNTLIVDAPIDVSTDQKLWQPKNFSGEWLGAAPLRIGLESSRNLMTVRLAMDVGMDEIVKYAKIFGLYDDMPELLSYSLGAGETSLFKLVSAYSIFANGGFLIEPTLYSTIEDRFGKRIFQNKALNCINCSLPIHLNDNPSPVIKKDLKRILDPIKVYQLNSMLRGVVERGTGSRTVGKLNLKIAGKTGTTNQEKDVWFVGYTPNLVVGCYMGYDIPRSLGSDASGGKLCGSIFSKFLKNLQVSEKSIADLDPSIIWPKPKGSVLISIDRETGKRIRKKRNTDDNLEELFRVGEEPTFGESSKIVGERFSLGEDLLLYQSQNHEAESHMNFLKQLPPTYGGVISGDEY